MNEPHRKKQSLDDHTLRDVYEQSLASRDAANGSSSLPLDRLDALVSREGDEAARLRALDIAMSSTEGRREFEVAWAASRAARPEPRRRFSPSWFAAAAAVLLATSSGAYMFARRTPPSSDVTEPLRGANAAITLIAPRKEVDVTTTRRFTWSRVASAERYTLVLVDDKGNEIFATTAHDTSLVLPDSVKLTSGGAYLWWVQTELPDGRTATAVTERVVVR